MKITTALSSLALLACTASAPVPVAAPGDAVVGDYVEARTASVFAGACHYNGEIVTTGHEAVLAWKIAAGRWDGTDLAGVRAMAQVSSPANLGDATATRSAELVVDGTDAQAAAFAGWLRERCGAQLGTIARVRRAAVAFNDDQHVYQVKSDGFASLSVHPMDGDACCTQPGLVWYAPLMPLDHRKVGFTDAAEYTAGTLGDAWQRTGENGAFYGTFHAHG